MRLKHFLSVFLTLLTLSVGQVWGAPTSVTINFGTTTNYWNTTSSTTFTDSYSQQWSEEHVVAGNGSVTTDASYIQYGNGSNKCNSFLLQTTAKKAFTLKTFTVTVTGSNGGGTPSSGTISLMKGSTTLKSLAVSGTSSATCSITSEVSISKDDILKVSYSGSKKGMRINQITYSYEETTPPCTNPSTLLSISSSNTATYGIDKTLETSGGNNGTVTWTVANGTGSATVSGNTLHPTSVGTVTVTATQDDNNGKCGKVVNQTITISKASATITLSEAGATRSVSGTHYGGDSYSLPTTTTASCGDKVLVGWSKVEVAETDTKPTSNYYDKGTSVTLTAGENKFYAVFATVSSGSGSTTATISQTALKNGISGTQAYGDDASPLDDNQGNTWTIKANSQVTGNYRYIQMRIYNNNNGVSYIQLPDVSGNISSITLTVSSTSGNTPSAGSNTSTLYLCADAAANVTSPLASGTGASSITLTPISNITTGYIKSGGGIRIWDIAITYSGTTYSNYSTTCCSPLGSINGSFSFTNVSPTSVTVGVPSDYSDKDDSDLTGYIFKRYTDATGGSAVETKETNTKSGTTATFNTNLAANTTYYYTITAKHSSSSCNSAETSPRKSHTIASYVVSYAAGGGSGTNPGAHPAVLSGTSVTLKANTFTAPAGKQFANWNDGTSNYNPNVSYTVTGNKTMTAQWSCITPTVTGPSSGASYTQGESADALEVSASGGTLSYQWKQCATVNGDYVNAVGGNGATNASYTPPTSNVGTLYYKCVVTNTGSSCNTTATSTPVAVTINEPSCTAPTAIAVSSEANTGATLTVTDDNNVNKYDFYCSTSSTKPANNATPTANVSDSKAKAITGLAYGTTYYYWARTDCGETKSPWYPDENPSTFTTTCPTPTSVAAGSLTLTGATLTITDNNSPAIGSYDIYYSTSPTAPEAGTTPSATTTSTSYDLTDLTSGQKYYFWVRGKGPNAKSAWVSGGNFTTLSITAISVQTAPKAAYLVGDNFDPTGLVITRTLSNSTSDTYTYANHTGEFTFSPETNVALAANNTAVTITYGGQMVNLPINVYPVTVNKVEEDGTTVITAGGVTADCSGRTLSQSVGSTNYLFNKWQVVAGDVTVSNNTISGTPTGNVTIKAVFYKPVTVTWKSNRQPVDAGAQTTSVKRGTQWKDLTLPADPSAPTSCSTKTFKGWTDMSEDWSGDSHDAAPTVCLKSFSGVTTAINDPITFKAVFATDNAGTKSLTNSEIESFYCNDNNCNPKTTEYANGPFTIPSDDGNWSGICAAGSVGTPAVKSLNIKNNKVTISNTEYRTYLLSPTCAENITKISVVATHQANSNRNLYICSEVNDNLASNNIGHIEVVNGNTSAQDITPSSNVKSFYICTSDAVQIRSVTIYYGSTGDYVTECCEAPETALSITSASSVATGGTVDLASTGGNGGTVTWSVVNGTGSATITGTTLTAGNVGTVTVKAHQNATGIYCAQDAEQAFTVVSSTVNVDGVTVNPTDKAIVVGETFTITPTVSPNNATDNSVSWSSNATDKATVTNVGVVEGKAAGTATITCTTTDGGKTATTSVTVYGVTLAAIAEGGDVIATGGPGVPSRTGASISPAADAGNYVFKEWQISGASLGSDKAIKSNTIANPTGAVTVTAVYYKPRVVKWSVNGNDSYATGGPTTAVGYNGTISDVPTNPSGLACASAFVGWTDVDHNNGQTAKDDDLYYEDALYKEAGDFPSITAATTTFYAVFAEQSNSAGYKYIGDAGTLADGKKYIFVDSKTAGSAHALKATDLSAPNSSNNGTAVAVTVTSTAEGVLVTTVNTDLEFEYVSSGTKLQYEVAGPATRYLFINGDGVGMKSDDDRSRYTTDAGLQGWNNKVTTYYDVYYNSTSGKFERKESADSRVYAFIKQTPTYSNYVTECNQNLVSVTYNENGGSTTCAGGSHDKTTDYTVCATEPTRDYYTFAGWNDGTTTHNAGTTIPAANINSDITLTAQWTPVTYNISYELDGGTNGTNPATYDVTTATFDLADATDEHRRFDGWYDNSGFTGSAITSIAVGSHGDKTLYAKWVERHEIVFDVNGVTTTIYRADDENLETAVDGQGTKPANPAAPTMCNEKVFVGWVDTPFEGNTDDEPARLTNATGTVNDNTHFYAVWADAQVEDNVEIIVFEDNLNVSGTDAVTSRLHWGGFTAVNGNNGDGLKLSSGKNAGTMYIDVSTLDKTLDATTNTISFKIKSYGDDDGGIITLDTWGEGSGTFSTTEFVTTNTSSWESKECTLTSVSGDFDIQFTGAQNRRIYLKDVKITKTGSATVYSAYSMGCNLVVDETPLNVTENASLTSLIVKPDGNVSVATGKTLTVKDVTIQSTSGAFGVAGTSGQLNGAGTVSVNGNLYLEIKLCDGDMDATASSKWYCIAAPFDVDINDGFYWGDGKPMVLNKHFQIFEWDGNRRASGASGWRRTSGTMKKDTAYFIGFDDERVEGCLTCDGDLNQNTIRLKAADNTISNRTKIVAPEHTGSADAETYGNWNGLANPNFHHIALNKNVQAFDYNKQGYSPYAFGEYNFVVGTPFFIQYAGDITIQALNDGKPFRAPQRESETYSYCVRIGSADASRADNQIYVRASETASAEFDNEHDMITLNNTTSNYGALLWTENYGGKRLAIEDAPLVNGTASYVLTLSAPASGSYVISVAEAKDNADLYLTYEGSIIWNLSMGAYEIELNKGTTNGYGLLLQAKAPQVVTGVDEVDAETGVQKIIIDEHVFILRGGQMYDVTGKMVK